jgi:hypothetical protein
MKVFVLLMYVMNNQNWVCRNYIHPYFNICIGYWQCRYCSFLDFLVTLNLSDGGANICNTCILKPLHKWNIIGSKNNMGIAWTWFFSISTPMGPQFYHEGIAKSRSIFIQVPPQYDWSIMQNLHFSFLTLWWKISKRRKNKIKLCNTHI